MSDREAITGVLAKGGYRNLENANAVIAMLLRELEALRDAGAARGEQAEQALRLAKEATNGWACYAKRKAEHDEISRLHLEIARLEATPSPTAQPSPSLRDYLTTFVERERALHDAKGKGGQSVGRSPSASPSVLRELERMLRADAGQEPSPSLRAENTADCGCSLRILPDGSVDQLWCAAHSRLGSSAAIGDSGGSCPALKYPLTVRAEYGSAKAIIVTDSDAALLHAIREAIERNARVTVGSVRAATVEPSPSERS